MRLVKNKRDNTVSTHLLSMREMRGDMNHITTLNHIITPITTHIHTTTVVITTVVVLEAEDSEEMVTEAVVSLEASMVVVALGALTEEAMEEAIGKIKK